MTQISSAEMPSVEADTVPRGMISNLMSLTLMILGLLTTLEGADPDTTLPAAVLVAGPWMLAAGVFGFAGGITNWLAVKMLFDRVPLLYGSGVIPNRFREIRATIKGLIMTHFFDEEYLRRFFDEHGSQLTGGVSLEQELTALLASDQADEAIEAELELLKQGPMGMMVKMAGNDMLKVIIKQFMGGLVTRIAPVAEARLRDKAIDVPALRVQVDRLLEVKLEELTPEIVKGMMERVMREHLGWLIVWGNVFGAAIGLLSRTIAVHWNIGGVP
jgi:uncharacterized membrane protein YheB (UPF0754 family)|tara:strand:+ start:999 stop:1817 length:819 start_codon:yes stop_codon:yes gene_type:complete